MILVFNIKAFKSSFYEDDSCVVYSGAGTILGQGGQGQRRQSLHRENWFFAVQGLLSVPKISVLQK